STQISESDLDIKGDGGVKCNNNKDKGTTTNTLNESQEHGSTSIEKGQSDIDVLKINDEVQETLTDKLLGTAIQNDKSATNYSPTQISEYNDDRQKVIKDLDIILENLTLLSSNLERDIKGDGGVKINDEVQETLTDKLLDIRDLATVLQELTSNQQFDYATNWKQLDQHPSVTAARRQSSGELGRRLSISGATRRASVSNQDESGSVTSVSPSTDIVRRGSARKRKYTVGGLLVEVNELENITNGSVDDPVTDSDINVDSCSRSEGRESEGGGGGHRSLQAGFVIPAVIPETIL
uniref:Uncharacterized protein n=1 Tax=Amphimedon queenslandica TaxID=400682 RepID=A0A1X7T513_AMPQE